MNKFVLIFLLCFGYGGLRAEKLPPSYWTGPTDVTTGSITTYTFNNGNVYPNVTWYITKGMPVSYSESGTTYTITVQWWQAGSGSVQIAYDEDIMIVGGTKNVSITGSTYVPVPNATFNTPTYTCGSTISTRNGTPPTQYVWYWQTSATGTSMTNNSPTFTQTTTGNLYLRAVTSSAPYTWSAAQSVGSRTVYSTVPSVPATATDGHVISPNTSAAVPVSVSASSGATSYGWYTSPTGGSVISGSPATNSWSPTLPLGTTTYYVQAANGPCISASRKAVSGNLYPAPQLTTVEGSVNMGSDATWSVSNYTYSNYQWINATTNTDILGKTGSSFTTNQTGSYKVRVTKGTATYTSGPVTVGTGLSGLNMNYVITNEIKKAGVLQASEVDTLKVNSRSQTIEYYDGLGRPLQTVRTQASPQKKDMVQPFVYDGFGRSYREYLPVVPNTVSGWYKPGIIDANGSYTGVVANFYTNNSAGKIAQDSKPYTDNVYEVSPQNRVQKQYSVGSDWSASSANKYSQFNNLVNVHSLAGSQTSEKIVAWKVNGSGMLVRQNSVAGFVELNGYYSTGQLYISETRDEHGYASREYRNKAGQLVLKKVQAVASENLNALDQWALTYYVYDEAGDLRYVLQPELSKKIQASDAYVVSQADLDGLAFQYTYDARKRNITKKLPGAGIVYMVYDDRDRIVLSQDGNQRTRKEWLFTKYDQLNRPIMTGSYKHADSINQQAMSQLVSTQEFYEVYDQAKPTGYSSTVFPTTNLTPYTIYFYDNYNFVTHFGLSAFAFNSSHLAGQETQYNQKITGELAGSKINILGTDQYLWTVNYYDEKFRTIQVVNDNSKGLTRTTAILDFAGKTVASKRTYDVTGQDQVNITERFTYDHGDRLLRKTHKINNAVEVVTAANEYNELGQLVVKKLHSASPNGPFKQYLDYRYNIRGWLTRINNSDLSPDRLSDPRDFFGLELGYNKNIGLGDSMLTYNGNISAAKWSANIGLSDTSFNQIRQRGYVLGYDPLNRLTNSSFREFSKNWKIANGNSEQNIRYDLNGNLLELRRSDSQGMLIDKLTYSYSGGNTLNAITDTGKPTKNFLDRNNSEVDYVYDHNGNLSADRNKGISDTHYNYLNLPDSLIKFDGDVFETNYDGDGIKVSETNYNASNQTASSTEFIGELIFKDNTLSALSFSEGQILIDSTADTEYQYYLKDHLGNIRLTFTTGVNSTDYKATFETNAATEESQLFADGYDRGFRSSVSTFNHTLSGTRSQMLNASNANSIIGAAKSLRVLPGDTVQMEVYVKYFDNSGSQTNVNTLIASAITSAFGLSTSSVGSEAKIYNSLNNLFIPGVLIGPEDWQDQYAPKAYLNYILFDEDFIPYDFGFDQISTNARETGSNTHEKLQLVAKAKVPGYIYVYLSNENGLAIEVYFDDLLIKHKRTPVIQSEDYYPFGLSLANTAFRQDDPSYKGMVTTFGLGKKDMGFRQYDAALGRFESVDPLAELSLDLSSYQFAGNNPTNNVEVLGMNIVTDFFRWVGSLFSKVRTEKRTTNGVEQNVWTGNKNKSPNRHIARAGRAKSPNRSIPVQAAAKKSKSNSKNSNTSSSQQETRVVDVFAPLVNRTQSKSQFAPQQNASRTMGMMAATTPSDVQSKVANATSGTEVNTAVSQSYSYINTDPKPSDLREYLYAKHFPAEARMLYARALVERQTPSLEEEKVVINQSAREVEAANDNEQQNPAPKSTPQEALAVIPETLDQSEHFSHVDPDTFLDQLRERVSDGGHEKTNQGAGTNFCWAAAIVKEAYEDDPKGMAEAMIDLYKTGTFTYDNNNGGMSVPEASPEARDAVGSDVFDDNQNVEDGQTINDIDQMLFMTLADHYKGYTNLDQEYDPGDEEDPLWSGGALSKAVQVWGDFGFDIEVMGVDAVGWEPNTSKRDLVEEALEAGEVVLYVNSGAFKGGSYMNLTATHYIHVSSVEEISDNDPMTIDMIEVKYWDYGGEHTQQMSPEQFHRSVYGIIQFPKN